MLKHFSDERQCDRKNPPRPCGFHPNAQEPRVWGPGLRRKSGHTSLPALTGGLPQPAASASSPPHGPRPVRGDPGSGPIFARNAARPNSVNRP